MLLFLNLVTGKKLGPKNYIHQGRTQTTKTSNFFNEKTYLYLHCRNSSNSVLKDNVLGVDGVVYRLDKQPG